MGVRFIDKIKLKIAERGIEIDFIVKA